MRKLKLSLDALEVESFDVTARAPAPGGTVRAHETTGAQIICDCETQGFECPSRECTELDCESDAGFCFSEQPCTWGYPGCPHHTLDCPPPTDFCV